jgi:hypothetical protein
MVNGERSLTSAYCPPPTIYVSDDSFGILVGGSKMKTNLKSRFRKLIFTIFALTAISFVGSFSRDARAQQPSYVGGAGITIFEDIDFAGAAR